MLPTRNIFQEQRSLVLISSVVTWYFPPLASGKDELAITLLKVQQLDHSRTVAVADWTNKQVLARQSQSDESNKEVINQISTVSRGAYPLSIVALAIALVALAIAIATFVTLS